MSTPLRVLAIDAGDQTSGWIILQLTPGDLLPVVVDSGAKTPNEDLLELMVQREVEYDFVCIEILVSYGMTVGATVFNTCLWNGKFWRQAEILGKEIDGITRHKAVGVLKDRALRACKTRGEPLVLKKSKDAQVRSMCLALFGPPGTRKEPGRLYGVTSHALAALTVGVAFLYGGRDILWSAVMRGQRMESKRNKVNEIQKKVPK